MCDTLVSIGSANAAGGVLFGKNSDREYDEPQYLQLVPAARHDRGARLRLTHIEIDQIAETHAVLLSRPHWIWGAEIGANQHGLVIGNEALFSRVPASEEPGIIGMDYVRLALERAADAEQGVAVITGLLARHGQSGSCSLRRSLAYHNAFLLADPRGAKVLETVDREWVVRTVRRVEAISNLFTTGTEFETASIGVRSRAEQAGIRVGCAPLAFDAVYADAARSASGRHRCVRATQLLQSACGSIQERTLFGILRDHVEGERPADRAAGPRICMHHGTRQLYPFGHTTASWVAALRPERRLHWVTATSAPCVSVFKPVMLESGLPPHGPKPRVDEDESVWWAHERLRRALDVAPADALIAFTAERDALETRFLEVMAKCPAAGDEPGRQEARAIIGQCWREALEFEGRWRARLQSRR